jgi:hypothetical protein
VLSNAVRKRPYDSSVFQPFLRFSAGGGTAWLWHGSGMARLGKAGGNFPEFSRIFQQHAHVCPEAFIFFLL